jgi:hypothetical protein
MSALDRERIIAFRLARHHLIERLGPRSLVGAASACGIQETPLGTAAVALAARVNGVTPASLDRALRRDRSLVHLWSLRGAPHLVPSRDLDVFTTGAMPADRASFDAFLGGWAKPIAAAGLDPFRLLDRMTSAARELLDERTMDVNELRDTLLGRVRSLSRITRPREARHDMPEDLYRALGVAGVVCIVEGRGTDSVLARVDQWLSRNEPGQDGRAARAELARRFLRCYGPSTVQRFAEWTTRSPTDARATFDLIVEELAEVDLGGKQRGWALAADVKALESPAQPSGVRLLPVLDPYLQQRDRAIVVPDERRRKVLWQPVRGPGAVLADGDIVATWRARTAGSRLDMTVEPFGRLARGTRDRIDEEAERVAAARGAESVAVALEERAS